MVDSLIIYKFTSLTDSVRFEKQIASRTDSVLHYTLTHTFRWNVTEEQWEEYHRERLDYTDYPDGKTTSRTLYRWDDAGALWERLSLITYIYNESDLLIRLIAHMPIESATNDEWRQSRKTEYNFDALGNTVLRIYYQNTASYPEVVWEGTGTKSEYKYTPDSQLQLYVRHRWDDGGGFWKFHESDEYLFNDFGFRTTQISWDNEGAGADSVLTEKVFFYPTAYYFTIYDSICSGGSYLWDGQEIDTEGSYEEAYVSLMENPKPVSFSVIGATEVVQDQEELYIAPEDAALSYSWLVENGTIVSGEESDTLASNLHGCGSDTTSILVSIGSNGLEEFQEGSLVLYPVPVRDVLHIATDHPYVRIEVLDASGRKVADTSGLDVDLSHLDSGVYLVRLKDREGSLIGTRNIIKQ